MRQRSAAADLMNAAVDGRITPAALMLVSHQSHVAAAAAHKQPLEGRQIHTHVAEKVQKRLPQAQAGRTLGGHNCDHCTLRAVSPTARGHWSSAPLTQPGL